MSAEAIERVEHHGRLLPEVGPNRVAALLVDLEARQGRRERGYRRRPRVEVRRRGGLEKILQLGRAG